MLIRSTRILSAAKQHVIFLQALKNDPHHHKIDGVVWHTVRKQCPHLRVHLYTEGTQASWVVGVGWGGVVGGVGVGWGGLG